MIMNWIPQLLAISDGDLTTPEVAKHAQYLWKHTLSDPYFVDDGTSFSNLEHLIRYIHVGREYMTALMDLADADGQKEFEVNGYTVRLNSNSGYQKFRPKH